MISLDSGKKSSLKEHFCAKSLFSYNIILYKVDHNTSYIFGHY